MNAHLNIQNCDNVNKIKKIGPSEIILNKCVLIFFWMIFSESIQSLEHFCVIHSNRVWACNRHFSVFKASFEIRRSLCLTLATTIWSGSFLPFSVICISIRILYLWSETNGGIFEIIRNCFNTRNDALLAFTSCLETKSTQSTFRRSPGKISIK